MSFRLHVKAHTSDCQSGILTDCKGKEEKRAESVENAETLTDKKGEKHRARSRTSDLLKVENKQRSRVLGVGEID